MRTLVAIVVGLFLYGCGEDDSSQPASSATEPGAEQAECGSLYECLDVQCSDEKAAAREMPMCESSAECEMLIEQAGQDWLKCRESCGVPADAGMDGECNGDPACNALWVDWFCPGSSEDSRAECDAYQAACFM